MGFNYHILGRIDDNERLVRFHDPNKGMEFMWIIDEELGSFIQTGVLFKNYKPPKGFDFDIRMQENNFMDDELD